MLHEKEPKGDVEFIKLTVNPDGKKYNFRPYFTISKENISAQAASNDVAIQHPGRNRKKVINEIIKAYPEDSFYFVNVGKLRERVRIFKNNFLPENPDRKIAYEVKANPRVEILKIISDEGGDDIAFDCASRNEYRRVLNVNPKAQVFFNHPVKLFEDIREAALRKIYHYTVDTYSDIEDVLTYSASSLSQDEIELAVQMQTLNDKAAGNIFTKFGLKEKEAIEIIKFIKEETKAWPGISIQIGFQHTDPGIFDKNIQNMAEVIREVGKVKTINVGEGIPVSCQVGDNYDVKEYLQVISKKIRKEILSLLLPEPKIIIESGRSMIAEAVDLLVSVVKIKDRKEGKSVFINDGLFTSFRFKAIHNWKYNLQAKGKGDRKLSNLKIPFKVEGQTCDSGDHLGKMDFPSDLQRGDFLHLNSAGAYLACQDGSFNGFRSHTYVFYNDSSY